MENLHVGKSLKIVVNSGQQKKTVCAEITSNQLCHLRCSLFVWPLFAMKLWFEVWIKKKYKKARQILTISGCDVL